MKRKIPIFKSDADAERFVDTADLSKYYLSGLKPVRFEFEKKSAPPNLFLQQRLLDSALAHSEKIR
jgi:hypothetical protein